MTNYPLLNIFLTMMWLFLWILWIFLLVRVVTDLFRSEDISGIGKAAWLILLIALPYLGVFAYLILRGNAMAHRESARAHAMEDAAREYLRETAHHGAATGGAHHDGAHFSVADELIKLGDLRERGVLTDEEFAVQKAKLLLA